MHYKPDDREIYEVYKEDTDGRKWHAPIISKRNDKPTNPEPSDAVTINMDKPMTKAVFNSISDEIKIAYLKHLNSKYGATCTEIANMLGYNPQHLNVIVTKRLGLKGLFGSNRHLSSEHKKLWKRFLTQETTTDVKEETVNPEIKPEPEKKIAIPPVTPTPPAPKVPTSDVISFTFTQSGCLDVGELAARINALIPNGTPCSISITANTLLKGEE